ncbi:Uncharacterized protein dnm_042330 [Desulfonema magnum]|uniref:Uncharacterized protein n=1 Tax=Desulfonema magnum TaxID=45655 RepID=A0A975BMC1_9BACT|nr:Uncharacterized protein dnm_042330 [Desulfonema magnum]
MKTEKSEKLTEVCDKRGADLSESGELKKIFEKWNVIFVPEAWTE